MRWEIPLWYDNYEVLGSQLNRKASPHAHAEYHTLYELIKHANFKLLLWSTEKSRQQTMIDYIKNNPNSINIFGSSAYWDADNKRDYEESLLKQDIIDLCKSKQFVIFTAWTNIEQESSIIKNKIYNWEYEADKHWLYSLWSMSNSNKNTQPNIHLLVTIATNADWNIDQTNETQTWSSKYPMWFANNVLFAWRTFPYHSRDTWLITAYDWKYPTSLPNYVNVAMTDLCFQLFAEVKDVDELLEMIRSTSLTDHIMLDLNKDGDTNDTYDSQTENQPLQLINPAWFFKKYLMPTNIPSNIQLWQTLSLEKWYYKWVIFDIPWAEVKINWQWVTYDKSNESLIKSQNPMNLEWRLNGNLCRKLWYKWKNLQWKIIVVDDKRNGLNMNKEFSVNIQ